MANAQRNPAFHKQRGRGIERPVAAPTTIILGLRRDRATDFLADVAACLRQLDLDWDSHRFEKSSEIRRYLSRSIGVGRCIDDDRDRHVHALSGLRQRLHFSGLRTILHFCAEDSAKR